MLKIHHLGHSQSERIVWLCEELEIPFTIAKYVRDPITRLSPPELRALHPLGAAPLLEIDGMILAESGAIVDFILARHGARRGVAHLRPGSDHPDFSDYLYWLHFANGNLQPTIFRAMLVDRCGLAADNPIRTSVHDRLSLALSLVDERLSNHEYLAGTDFTAADIMNVFSLTTMRIFQPIDLGPYSAIRRYLQRIGGRPAYQRAMAKADPDLVPLLT